MFSQFVFPLLRFLLIKLMQVLFDLLLSKFWEWGLRRYGQPLITRLKRWAILIYLYCLLNR